MKLDYSKVGNKFSTTYFIVLYILIVRITLVCFLISTFLAVVFYPCPDRCYFKYLFLYSFISELGVTVTSKGLENLLSCLIFNISLAFSMLVTLPYWYIRKNYLLNYKYLRNIIFFCCCLFSMGIFIGAVVPDNISHRVHTIAIDFALFAGITSLLMMIIFTKIDCYSQKYKLSWLVFMILFLLVEIVLQYGIVKGILPSRPTNPVLQKANILVFLVWLFTDTVIFKMHLLKCCKI